MASSSSFIYFFSGHCSRLTIICLVYYYVWLGTVSDT